MANPYFTKRHSRIPTTHGITIDKATVFILLVSLYIVSSVVIHGE